MPQDPTAAPNGLPIEHDAPVEEYRDVFDYVLRKWKEANPAIATGPLAALATEYATFARRIFESNKPIGMDYLGQSLALRFQDGLVVPFIDAENGMSGVGGIQGGVDMAKPDNSARRGGKGATVNTAVFGVTGNDERK